MAQLGDKKYDYNFYGLPDTSRVWGTAGVGGYAALVGKNMYMQVFDTDYNHAIYSSDASQSPAYGKPLDETIKLWYLPRNSSFACNAIFSVDRSPILSAHYTVNVENNDVPLAMCAVDASDGAYGHFNRDLDGRYAYDVSDVLNGPYSAPIFDIVYNNFCLRSSVTYYNMTTKARANIPIDSIHSTFTDENVKAVFIQNALYRAATTPRFTGNDYIPPLNQMTTAQGQPLIDTLTPIPIPENETYLKSVIRRGHDNWRDDIIYRPWFTQIQQMLYNGIGTNTISNQINIGFDRQLTVNQIKNGAYLIADNNRISAQYYRCNYDAKYFDDVSYRWINVVYDETNLIPLDNGFNLNLLSNSSPIRFMTVLDIIDRKGNTYGQAVENAIKHEIAYIGMYFTSAVSTAQNAELGTAVEGVYLPLFSGGVTTGEYVTGDDIPLQPHANAQSVSEDTFHYDDAQIDTDAGFPDEVTAIPRFGRTYLCTLADIEFMNYNLKTMDWSEENREELFFGQNPYDFIISATAYPLVDYPLSPAATLLDIELGKVNLNELPDKVGDCTGYPIMGGVTIYPEPFGELYVKPYYSDSNYELSFLDYAPYTSIYLVLPYADVVSIPPEVFMGNTIGIRMGVDFMSGNVIYFIYVKESGILFTTASGNMATEIPISGLDYTEYKKAQLEFTRGLFNTTFDTLNETAGHIAGSSVSAKFHNDTGAEAQAFMGIMSAGKGLAKMGFDIYEFANTAPSPVAVSAGSASLGTAAPQDAKLFILRPKLPDDFDVTDYKMKYGKSTASTGPLNSSTGFTQMLNPILDGIDCTAEEKMMIVDALKGGVIL